MTTNLTDEQHHNNATHHYVQALHKGLDTYYHDTVQAALDALHTEALADDTAREAAQTQQQYAPGSLAWNLANPTVIDASRAGVPNPLRAYWLDSDLISGMFTAMTHAEIYGTDREYAYGEQEIVSFAGEDFTPMFNLD